MSQNQKFAPSNLFLDLSYAFSPAELQEQDDLEDETSELSTKCMGFDWEDDDLLVPQREECFGPDYAYNQDQSVINELYY